MVPLTKRTVVPSNDMITIVDSLLNRGITVVIVSGRGHSLLGVRNQLSTRNRKKIVIAPYNGAEIFLGNKRRITQRPLKISPRTFRHRVGKSIEDFCANVKFKRYSIQIIPRSRSKRTLDTLTTVVRPMLPPGLVARSSGFAVDVFPTSQLKDTCLSYVSSLLRKNLRSLRVGDQGHELGNDYELLNVKGGFSVGTLSRNPFGCYPVVNCSGQSKSGVNGTEYLLGTTFGCV